MSQKISHEYFVTKILCQKKLAKEFRTGI